FGAAALGNFFFLQTLFVFPSLLLSTYMGFKDLVFFKRRPSRGFLHRRARDAALLGLGLTTCTFALVATLGVLGQVAPSIWSQLPLILALGVVAIVRLVYAVLSSAVGALAAGPAVLRANGVSLAVLILGTFVAWVAATTILQILLVFAVMWLI